MAQSRNISNAMMRIGKAGALGGGLASLGAGIFGDPGSPYEAASEELDQYLPQAQGYQEPFYEAGKGAIPGYQSWLGQMQDPGGFVNNLMGQYEESPYAKYQQQQMMRAARNMGSATGLGGSTPMAKFMEQQAGKISSGDMQNWLQNVLGVSGRYGAGMGDLMGRGQTAANALTQMLSNLASSKAQMAYGEGAAEEGGLGEMMSGLGQLAMFAML